MYTLILAASPTEAMRYAAEQGMPNRTARPVVSAAAINGLRVSTVIELPSYARRPDRFAIEAVLRKAERRDHFERIVLDHWEPREPLAREKTGPTDPRATIKLNDDVWNDHQDEPVLVPTPVPVEEWVRNPVRVEFDIAEAERLLGQKLGDEITSSEQIDEEINAAESRAMARHNNELRQQTASVFWEGIG